MRGVLGIAVGFLLGGVLGFYLGIFAASAIFDAGNLRGLLGVSIGPLGALGGGITGLLLCRPRSLRQAE